MKGRLGKCVRKKVEKERGNGSGVGVRKVGRKERGKWEKQRGGGGVRTWIRIRLFKVQGLTEVKYMVLKNDFLVYDRIYNLLFLTETQQKVEKMDEGEGVFVISRMMREGDKKGRGLMIV